MRLDEAGLDEVRQGRQGVARLGKTRQGWAMQAWRGMALFG